MGRERRRSQRKRARIRVAFGTDAIDSSGFSRDISIGGLFITASALHPTGTGLHLRVDAQNGCFYIEGVVVRAQRVPANLRRVQPQGMGIRFLTPPELVAARVPHPQSALAGMGVECTTPAELERFLVEQLASGVLVVPVGKQPPVVGTDVDFTIRLAFSEDTPTIAGSGRVVQVLDTVGGQPGPAAVLEVKEAQKLCSVIAHTLGKSDG